MFNIPISLIISFISTFGKTKILEIAKEAGFVIRQSKIQPDTIVKVFTYGLWNTPNPSLKQTACKCEDVQPGLKISKVAIFNRLKASAALLKEIFRITTEYSARKSVTATKSSILNQFADVKICDSTKITLPDKLAETWKGLGGEVGNAKASLKIQTIYSIKTRSICNMELTKSPGTDAGYREELIKHLNPGELIIVDLGYYSKHFLKDVMQKEAYYLSRIKRNTVFHIQKADGRGFVKLDLLSLLRKNVTVDMELMFGVSVHNLLKCRLVAVRLPQDIADERRRKAHKKAKTQGKTVSDYEVELLGWNILITNVPSSMLSTNAACDLYRARWQIELLFKACKSHLNIEKVGSCGKEQLECLIYGKLIALMLTCVMYSVIYRHVKVNENKMVSMISFIKLIATKADSIINNLKLTASSITCVLFIFQRTTEHCLYDTRNRKTSDEVLEMYPVPLNITKN